MLKESRKIYCKWRTSVLLVSVLLLLWTGVIAFAENGPVGRGEKVFEAKCSSCHTIGGGRKVGPDLKGITEERHRDWIEAFISNPEKVFASKDSIALGLLKEYKIKMPGLGLSKEDVSAVLDFLGTKKSAVQTSTTPSNAPPGDAGQGKSLFMGSKGFRNGGAPCMSCHSVAGINLLGGGSLGPELTRAYLAYGEGIVSVLTNIPFPTMLPIFKKHPLDAQEARDLTAFFKEVAASQPQDFTLRVLITALVGFLVLMLMMWYIWQHRLRSVREEMLSLPAAAGKRGDMKWDG
jgi:mono/diheme cytochrome c family protein